MLDTSARLDDSVRLVGEGADQEEASTYRKAVGRVMGQIYCDILRPIYDQYPALTPTKLGGS